MYGAIIGMITRKESAIMPRVDLFRIDQPFLTYLLLFAVFTLKFLRMILAAKNVAAPSAIKTTITTRANMKFCPSRKGLAVGPTEKGIDVLLVDLELVALLVVEVP